MRAAILAHLDAGGAGLDPNVRDAIEALKIGPRVPLHRSIGRLHSFDTTSHRGIF